MATPENKEPSGSCHRSKRSLVTVASLTTSGNTDQLVYHLGLAKDNGATE